MARELTGGLVSKKRLLYVIPYASLAKLTCNISTLIVGLYAGQVVYTHLYNGWVFILHAELVKTAFQPVSIPRVTTG